MPQNNPETKAHIEKQENHPRKNAYLFMKRQSTNYKSYGTLVTMLVLIFAFQNCKQNDRIRITSGGTGSTGSTGSTLGSSNGYKAILELYGVSPSQVTSAFWLIKKINPTIFKSQVHSTQTGSKIEIDWNEILNQNISQAGAFIALSGQNCISYRHRKIQDIVHINQPSGGSEGGFNGTVPVSSTTSTTFIQSSSGDNSRLPSHVFLSNAIHLNTSQVDEPSEPSMPTVLPEWEIKAQITESDGTVHIKDYFSVGSSVSFSVPTGYSYSNHQWSVQRLFETKESLTVSDNTADTFSHTFDTRGLYEVSVTATTDLDGSNVSDTQHILIGLCEGEEEAIEVVFNPQSFGDLTPQKFKTMPFFNYLRPTDTEHPVKLTIQRLMANTIAGGSGLETRYSSYEYAYQGIDSLSGIGGNNYSLKYKYNRTSSSKVIAMDLPNFDDLGFTCFFDDEPVLETIESCTEMACIPENPDCNICSQHTEYTRPADLTPLNSCSGVIYEMGTLDTDTTECAEDVFVVGIEFPSTDSQAVESEGGQSDMQHLSPPIVSVVNSGIDIPFYKYCEANQQFCYFGREMDRPEEHHCPTESIGGTTSTSSSSSSSTSL